MPSLILSAELLELIEKQGWTLHGHGMGRREYVHSAKEGDWHLELKVWRRMGEHVEEGD